MLPVRHWRLHYDDQPLAVFWTATDGNHDGDADFRMAATAAEAAVVAAVVAAAVTTTTRASTTAVAVVAATTMTNVVISYLPLVQ